MSKPVPQSEIVAELGLPQRNMAAIRRKHLTSEDWWAEGRGGKVWLTPEGATKLRIYAECRETDPQVVPRFEEVAVIGQCPNPQWIWIEVDHGERGKLKEKCAVPRKLHPLMTRGKRIRVEVVRDATGVSYRHELLATRY